MWSQYIVNGLQTGALTALVGVGFLLVYKTSRFFNFAHGAFFTCGAYLVFLLSRVSFFIPVIAISTTVVLLFIFGNILERSVFRPLRNNSSTGNTLLIAAIGIYVLVQNTISLSFGDDTVSFRWWGITTGVPLFGSRITVVQICIVLVSYLLVTMTWLFIRFSRIGKKMDAVASDVDLARTLGIDAEHVYLISMGLSAALASVAGTLRACDVDISPTMGMQPLMLGVVAAIIGGGTIWGTVFGALLLGMAQHIGIIWIPTQWQDAIAFVILLMFLFLRPQGFFGKKGRVETV